MRLESVFQSMGKEPEREKCQAMAGLIREGDEMLNAQGDSDVKDAALIASAQRIEHYEIAGYGTACILATRIGRKDACSVLAQTLEEEKKADKKLTEVAEGTVNADAPKT